jgi:hypothetical protein
VFCLHVRDTSLLGEDQCPRDHVEYMEDDYDMDDATDNTCDGHHERGIRPELRFEGCESREVILRKNLGKCDLVFASFKHFFALQYTTLPLHFVLLIWRNLCTLQVNP